jgi:hypothetical protein
VSEPNVYEEPVVTPKENTLKRAAKAFYAKARAAAKAVANKVAGFLNGHETTPADAEKVTVIRTIARVVAGVFHAVATAIAIAAAVVAQAVVALAYLFAGIAGAITLIVIGIVMALYKVVQGLALVLSSPFHLAQSTEAFKTNWELYLKSWKPAYFSCFRLQTVAYREYLKRQETKDLVEANIEAGTILPPAPEVREVPEEVVFKEETLATVHSFQEHKDAKAAAGPEGGDNHPAGKGAATPRQKKSRPRRPQKPATV